VLSDVFQGVTGSSGLPLTGFTEQSPSGFLSDQSPNAPVRPTLP